MKIKFYDPEFSCIVQTGERANEQFWDKSWQADDFGSLVAKVDRFVVGHTRKYLKPNAKVLEGGCGRGNLVYSLKIAGFDAYGVDFAPETVKKVNELFPELNIKKGDICNLDFPDSFFDGYWSNGVIEHFYEGYDLALSEMKRVIKKDGILFLSVPSMSPLRKFKVFLGLYEKWENSQENERDFYQFILSPSKVINDFTENGFALIAKYPHGGMKGFKDDCALLKPLLQYIYDSSFSPFKVLNALIGKIADFFAPHVYLYIFKLEK